MFIFNQFLNSKYKKLKGKSNYLIIIISIIILINSCTHISPPSIPKTGSIYGKIEILNRTENSSKEFKLRVQGTGFTAEVDTSGIFYVSEVPPGEYTLIASAPGFLESMMEKVFVVGDSISIVSIWLKFPSYSAISGKETWKGIRIGKVGVKLGKIKGHVRGPDRAIVCIENTFWTTYTDSLGEYQLTNILPGKYTLKAYQYREGFKGIVVGSGPKEGMLTIRPEPPIHPNKIMNVNYKPGTVENVRVAPDSTSIVDIWLWSTWIPEDPPPIERKENIIKNSE